MLPWTIRHGILISGLTDLSGRANITCVAQLTLRAYGKESRSNPDDQGLRSEVASLFFCPPEEVWSRWDV